MTETPLPDPEIQSEKEQPGGETSSPEAVPFRSLRELVDRVTAKELWSLADVEDAGIAESLPYPFLAMVGQPEMKLALLLNLVNPGVGGVLLIGPRGTGKTTAVRSLVDLLPYTPRSLCYYGCMPEDIEAGGMDAVCPECARKYGQGEPLTRMDRVRLVELPLNAGLDEVVGGVDELAAIHGRVRFRKGILALADRNLLYIDEVNLLPDEVVDAILDAAAQGRYTVRRGPLASTYRARFVLIGSMNPEEGRLRPQIMDRFGLRVVVRGLQEPGERLEVYKRVQAYQNNPRRVAQEFVNENNRAAEEIQSVRDSMVEVVLPDPVAQVGLNLINQLQIDSARAEITLFEAARAYAALDGRKEVVEQDLNAVAPMALRMRRSNFMEEYFQRQEDEEEELRRLLGKESKSAS
jgi:magnesium chelatase subunit I